MANKMTHTGPGGPSKRICNRPGGRFIEAERSIKAGTWIEREGGLWALEIEPATAAPEMLDALRKCIREAVSEDHEPREALLCVRDIARAAIAKAEGR